MVIYTPCFSPLSLKLQAPLSSPFNYKFSVIVTKRAPPLSLTRQFSTRSIRMPDSSIADPHCSSKPNYTEIVLVRHGETAWNADGKIQGQSDIELNETGRQQAAVVAERLSKEPKISAVYSSDLQRAVETAQIIASKCGGLQVIKDVDLRERHAGELEGIVYHEAPTTHPISFKALMAFNDEEIPGGGESGTQVLKRCKAAMLRIGRKHKGERVVVVTHGGSLVTLYLWACPNGKDIYVSNTSIGVFHLNDEDEWTLKVWDGVSL